MGDIKTTPETCLVCRKHRGEWITPGGAIYEDDLVYVSHAQIRDGEDTAFIGTLFVEPKRHADGMEDLTEEEAQAVGLWASRVARALKIVTDADRIYILRFGHHVDHLHVWVVARHPGTPEEYWGTKVDEWPEAPYGDADEIAAFCDQIREEMTKDAN
jgi:diadenosine tetraphosphate (Ap4A) HIT family hydrolase